MKVAVRYFGYIRSEAGGRHDENVFVGRDATVSALLDALIERHGRSFKEAIYRQDGVFLRAEVLILVNGQTIGMLNDLDTKLKDGDLVQIMPTISGG